MEPKAPPGTAVARRLRQMEGFACARCVAPGRSWLGTPEVCLTMNAAGQYSWGPTPQLYCRALNCCVAIRNCCVMTPPQLYCLGCLRFLKSHYSDT